MRKYYAIRCVVNAKATNETPTIRVALVSWSVPLLPAQLSFTELLLLLSHIFFFFLLILFYSTSQCLLFFSVPYHNNARTFPLFSDTIKSTTSPFSALGPQETVAHTNFPHIRKLEIKMDVGRRPDSIEF